MKSLPIHIAALAIAVLLVLTSIYHILAITGVIPMDMVWGGRLQNREEMLLMESVGLAINLVMITTAALRTGWIKSRIPKGFLRASCWFFAALFLLNTLGNLAALNSLETYIFTPITFVLALLFGRLGMKD